MVVVGWGRDKGWQISIDCPACPSVSHQKAEFICVIQAFVLSCPRLGPRVARQREGLACTYGQHTAPAARNKQIPNNWTVAERVGLCVRPVFPVKPDLYSCTFP